MGKLDLAVIIIVGLFILIGFKKGLVKQILSVANWLVALVGSFLLFKPVSSQMLTTSIASNVNQRVADWIAKTGDGFTTVIDPAIATEQLTKAINDLGLPKFIASMIAKGIDVSNIDAGTTLAKILAPSIGTYIIYAITFIGLFIILFILLKILVNLIDSLFKGAILGFVNRMLGAGLGFVKGTIIICLLMFLASILTSIFPSIKEFITTDIGNSSFGLGKYFYENNPLVKIIDGKFSFDDVINSLTSIKYLL